MKRILIPLLAAALCTSLSADVSVFQQGVDGYAGTVDTEIRGGDPDTPYGNVDTLNPDGSDGGGEVHILLRFDDIIGAGTGQIPSGKQIFSVVLTLTVNGPGDTINFHRMNKAWTETVTWNEFDPINADGVLAGTTGGRTADDTEAVLEIDGTVDPNPAAVYDIELDPATVQAWVDGTAQNYGWAILPTGGDGVDFRSSEYATIADRPKLTVTWGEAGQPFVVGIQNTGPDGFDIVLDDGSGSGVNAATVQVQLDGADVTTTQSKVGTRTTVTYATTDYLDSGSQHTATISFSDNGTPPTPQTVDLPFTVTDYATVPIEYAVDEGAVNKSLSGFRVRVHHITAEGDGTTVRSNNLPDPLIQLAGELIDPGTGQPYPNDIYREDPQLGIPISYTWQPFDANDVTVVDSVINWEHTRGLETGGTPVDAGNFIPDDPVPGIPGIAYVSPDGDNAPAFNNIVAGVTTFLELKQGLYRMGVNSDDGFVVDVGITPTDALALRLGLFDGGRGSADTIFLFEVLQDGIYPFRLVWWEGNGGASVEWFTVDRDGNKTLVNDSAVATSVKAYQEGPIRPQVKSVDPMPDATNVQLDTNIEIVLEDGTTQVQASSVELSVNGQAVTPTVNKAGALTTITYDPPTDFPEQAVVTVSLTFADNAATPNVRTEEYSFTGGYKTQLLFAIDDTMMWRYDNTYTDRGTAWREKDYDDSSWPEGAALLARETGATAEPIRTEISRTGPNGEDIITDYFRGRFTLTELPFGGRLLLRHVVDDSVRFYINGEEVHSFNLTGDINWLTQGAGHENAYEGPYLITANNLVVGENVIAAEVHQSGNSSSDVVFGAELAVITSQPAYPQITARSPAPDAVNVPVDTNIQIDLLDGAGQVQESSIQLSINGQAVTPTVTKNGPATAIVYDPPANLPENTLITVDLAFNDNANPPYQGTDTFSFTTGFDPVNWDVVLAVDETTLWRYSNDGTDQGTAWKETAFDDSAWPQGAALLAAESGTTIEPIRTTLTRMKSGSTENDIITDYFRGRFTLTELPEGGQMLLSLVVDDGVVVYINGNEVHRLGIANDIVVDANTLASSYEGRNQYTVPALLTVDNLVVGENVIAAEVHQTTADSSDSVFGLQLSAKAGAVTDQPQIDPPVISGSDITITWSNGGELQSSSDLVDWTGTGNSTGSFSEPLGATGNKFYRVVRP